MATRSGALLSYARVDGEAHATALRERLQAEAPDIRVWQDRPEIEGGIGWWRQIEEALERVEFLILVLTPGVLASQVTRKEWHQARQSGVCVFPVMGPGFRFDDPALPAWLRRVHIYDLGVQWATFLAHLRRGCQATRVPFMAPPLPAGLVARPREFGSLRALVLDERTGETVAITTSLAGAGGFGKTTLATALCHDDAVVTAYDDGILWSTLGQTPNVQGELTRLYAALTGERPGFISIEDAAQALADKLAHKRCLIVVDDVWDVTHLKPFLRGGADCTRLVTTRHARVAAEGQRVSVDEMTTAEAVSLLVVRLPTPPADLEPFRRLAQRLGEWPLLVKLCAAALRQRIERGDTLEGALRYVDRALAKRGVTAFDRDRAMDRSEAVASTLGMSLDLLDTADRTRCLQLAVFPEDLTIPAAVIAQLWGLDELDVEETLSRLHDATLIEFDLGAGTVRIHDVTAECLGGLLGPQATAAAHAQLLAAWGDFHALPHRHAWRWLGHHLAHAGRLAELRTLLLDYRWLRLKLEATDITSLLADFRWFEDDAALRPLEGALRLSSHVLGRDKSQLASQLLGRMTAAERAFGPMVDAHEADDAGGDTSGNTSGDEGGDSGADSGAHTAAVLRPRVPSLVGPGGALVRTLQSPGVPMSVAVTPDGRWIIASTVEGLIVVWDHATGAQVRTLAAWPTEAAPLAGASEAAAAPFAMRPDGNIVYAGSQGLALWNPAGDDAPRILYKPRDPVASLAVSPDGTRALLGSRGGALTMLDLSTGEVIADLRSMRVDVDTGETIAQRVAHRLGITAVAFEAAGRLALTGSYDKTLRLWHTEEQVLLETLYPPHEGIVYTVATARAAPIAASGSADRMVRIWNLDTQACTAELAGHTHRVYDLALSADGQRLLSASHDRTVRLWNVAEGTCITTLRGHSDAVVGVAFTPGERTAVSASRDGTVRVWQLDGTALSARTQAPEGPAKEGQAHQAQAHEGWIQAVAMSRDGRVAITAGQDHRLRVWNTADATVQQVLAGHNDAVSALKLDADGQTLVSGSYDCRVKVWRLGQDDALHVLKGHAEAIVGVLVDAAAGRAITASADGELIQWDIHQGRLLKRWDAHRRGITFLAAAPGGQTAVTGSSDGEVKLWNLATMACERALRAHLGGVTAGAVDATGQHLLTGSADGELRLWRLPTCELAATTQGHAGRVRSIVFARDRAVAITTSYDHYLRAWAAPGLALLAAFAADSAIAAADVDDAGTLVVGGDAQGQVHFLDLGMGRG